jgi:membrane-bound lytic murein transglycosylase D
VRNGDNLWVIARTHNVSVKQLMQWNNLSTGASIRPGQQLAIRQQQNPTLASSTVRPVNYTVRKGDSLSLISQKFNVSINDLKEWNALEKEQYLRPGQNLKLYIDAVRLSQNSQG